MLFYFFFSSTKQLENANCELTYKAYKSNLFPCKGILFPLPSKQARWRTSWQRIQNSNASSIFLFRKVCFLHLLNLEKSSWRFDCALDWEFLKLLISYSNSESHSSKFVNCRAFSTRISCRLNLLSGSTLSTSANFEIFDEPSLLYFFDNNIINLSSLNA